MVTRLPHMNRRFPLDKTRNVLTPTRQRILVYNY